MKINFLFWKKKNSAEGTEMVKKDPVYMPAWFVGLAQAIASFAYLGFISFFSAQSQEVLYGKLDELTGSMLYFGIIILSTLALGLIFLGYPMFLYQRGLARRALSAVGYTFLWLLLAIAFFVAIIARMPAAAQPGLF